MYQVDAPFPPGTIIIPTNELSRYSDFARSLMGLKIPVGSQMWWQKGVEIAMGINTGIRQMVGEWVFILGDDHAFDGDLLLNLLALDLDVVVPAVASRMYPFQPVCYMLENAQGRPMQGPWGAIPADQVSEVVAAGGAGMLIKKRVLDAIGDPWFKAGRHHADTIGEDLFFCKEARAKGFKVHIDTREKMGHITPSTIWPATRDGKMLAMANFNGDDKRWVALDKMIVVQDAPPAVAPNWMPKFVENK